MDNAQNPTGPVLTAAESRRRVLHNMCSSLLYNLSVILFGLLLPRLYLTSFGSELNGLDSTIKQIFSCLTLLEAGVGLASQQAYYLPVAVGDGKAINGIQVIIPDPFGNEEYTHRDTLITNSAGEFVARPVVTTFGTDITFKITTKDIDGTDNGGAFEETITEVAFKKEDLTGGNGEWNYGNAQKNVTIKMKQAVENKE